MTRTVLFPLLVVLSLLLTAACCGSECSSYLVFTEPVADMTITMGDTASVELFRNVWQINNDCYYGDEHDEAGFPEVEVFVRDDRFATAELRPSLTSTHRSRLLLRALRPGATRVVLRATATEDCNRVYGATHFRLTVQAPSP